MKRRKKTCSDDFSWLMILVCFFFLYRFPLTAHTVLAATNEILCGVIKRMKPCVYSILIHWNVRSMHIVYSIKWNIYCIHFGLPDFIVYYVYPRFVRNTLIPKSRWAHFYKQYLERWLNFSNCLPGFLDSKSFSHQKQKKKKKNFTHRNCIYTQKIIQTTQNLNFTIYSLCRSFLFFLCLYDLCVIKYILIPVLCHSIGL